MPIDVTWQIPDRVVRFEFNGVITWNVLESAVLEMVKLLGSAPDETQHFLLIDTANAERIAIGLLQAFSTARKLKEVGIKRVTVVGMNSPIVRRFVQMGSAVMGQKLGMQVKLFDDAAEALEHLADADPSLAEHITPVSENL